MKKSKVLALVAAGVITLGAAAGFSGCKKGAPQGSLNRGTTLYVQLINYTKEADKAYERLASVYNETQGVEDDVEVIIDEQSTVGNISSQLRPNAQNFYDIMTIDNMTFKEVLVEYLDGANAIVPLDEYLQDAEFAEALGLDSIPETSMDMWKMTQESDEDGFFYAGAGQPQLALPFFNNPQVLFYNTDLFEGMGINIISVPEGKLDDYNKEHGTNLKPHGYAEYTSAAVGGDLADKTSENMNGKTVVKVFNNAIPMNWEELRTVAQMYQKANPGMYGYMSEWWFNYGWSVGGDCIGWNGEEYELTLGDETKGLLVIDKTLKVNETTYYQGDVLDYEDLHSLSSSERSKLLSEKRVAELPSMYEAFVEFNRLGVPSDKKVTDAAHGNLSGYGIAQSTVDDRSQYFSAGTSPMLCEYYSTQNSYIAKLGDSFDIAPLAQYREYEGDPYDDGVLKVIGEDGYTGDLKTAENSEGEQVPVVGEAVTVTEPMTAGMFLPANSDPANREAALKYMAWACGPEGQAILDEGNTSVPTQSSFMDDEEFLGAEGRVTDNMYAALFANSNSYVGDWSYDSNDAWITTWSDVLNKDVRRGDITIDQFLKDRTKDANDAIKGIGIYTKRT